MRRHIYIWFGVVRGGLLSLILIFGTLAAYAGDEDMSPSAYHVFDPETGYMITVDPLDEEQQDSAAADDISPKFESTVVIDQRAARVSWQYWIAAIVVAAGIIAWLHKRRESHN